MKNLTRRNFLSTSAKIFAGAAMFGIFPDFAEAAKKKSETPPVQEKILVPEIKKIIPLEDLEIGSVPLEFGSMDKRPYTGAIVVHHTGMRDIDMTVAEIHDLHVNQNKWSGIGYHFVVHKDGTIEHGRPLEAVGAHALSNNQFTVGICLTGNYDIGKPNEAQLLSAEQLLVALCDKYKIEPDDLSIFGHRDLSPTNCPGDSLYALLPEIISNLQKVIS